MVKTAKEFKELVRKRIEGDIPKKNKPKKKIIKKKIIKKVTKRKEFDDNEKLIRVVADSESYDNLVKKYPAISIPALEIFIKLKCDFYSTVSQDDLETRFAFEDGKKFEWYDRIADSILLVDRDYKKPKKVTAPKITEEKNNDKSYIEYVDEELKEGDNDRFFNIKYSKKTGKIIKKEINVEFTANYLKDKYSFKTLYGNKTEKIRLYDGRIFSKGARGLIKSLCEKIFESYAKKNIVEEIFDKVKRKTKVTEEEFNKTDLYLIPLENGCYNIKTKKIEPHSPENNFTFYSPIKYNLNAKCPMWFKFISETLYPCDIKVMKQWFGFNLFRQYFIKKALILLGKKDTGKTILLDILIYFVGEKNKCGLSLHKITTGSDFTKLALKDKLSNIYDDLSSADISDGGAFKISTGGGYISGEEKFGEFVQFKPYAKITLAGNKAPAVKDNDDDAYFSRYLPIKCDNVPEKIDPFLRDKIQTEEEMSGVLNWALEGLHEILESGKFNFDKNDEEIKKIMEMSGDILIQFGTEVLEQSTEKISKDDMYKIYCIWANERDKPILSKEQLGRRLNQKVKYLVPKQDAKKRFWDNVKLKQIWEEKFDKSNLKGNQDTLDTFSNNMRKNEKEYKSNNKSNNKVNSISLGKVSNPSKIDFSKSGIKEELEK